MQHYVHDIKEKNLFFRLILYSEKHNFINAEKSGKRSPPLQKSGKRSPPLQKSGKRSPPLQTHPNKQQNVLFSLLPSLRPRNCPHPPDLALRAYSSSSASSSSSPPPDRAGRSCDRARRRHSCGGGTGPWPDADGCRSCWPVRLWRVRTWQGAKQRNARRRVMPRRHKRHCHFWLSKHRLSNTLSQHQSNSQAELSKSTTENFKVSKRKRTRSLSEYMLIYQSSLQYDFCIPNHLVTTPVTKGRASPPWKNFLPPEKMSWTYFMHNHCFRCYMLCYALLHVINVKCGLPSEHYSSPLVSPAGYGSAGDCCLWRLLVTPLNSVFSQSKFSGLT